MNGDLRTRQNILLVALALVVFGVLLRLAPHPANFAPVGAIALIGGATLRDKWAFAVPVAAMIISDMFIGLHDVVLFTWGSFALIAILSARFLAKRLSLENVIVSSFISAAIFFIVTNFGVWLVSGYYPLSFAGLMQSYTNAIPFFRNTLLSDAFYGVGLYSVYVLVSNTRLSAIRILNTQTH